MLVLLYSTCRSVSVLSCVDVILSFTYSTCVTCCYSDVTKRRGKTAREKARGNTNGLSKIPSKEKKLIKQELLAIVVYNKHFFLNFLMALSVLVFVLIFSLMPILTALYMTDTNKV